MLSRQFSAATIAAMRHRAFLPWATALLLLAATLPTRAAVTTGASGFLVTHDVAIAAPPSVVYDTIVSRVGAWWNPQHSYTHDGANLSIDARPGGCFCERFPEGGGIEHMRVLYVAPGAALRMAGALGPLQASGLAGSLTWKLGAAGAGTRLELSYSVGGFMAGGFERMAPAVDAMLGEQVQRLRLLLETGSPAPR
jgi:uncharacterized protein YndB with AHSA1/START domain